eukprot:scaffold6913_cov73-Skeletonema_dohrnii-CCMP3373.AAC.1
MTGMITPSNHRVTRASDTKSHAVSEHELSALWTQSTCDTCDYSVRLESPAKGIMKLPLSPARPTLSKAKSRLNARR